MGIGSCTGLCRPKRHTRGNPLSQKRDPSGAGLDLVQPCASCTTTAGQRRVQGLLTIYHLQKSQHQLHTSYQALDIIVHREHLEADSHDHRDARVLTSAILDTYSNMPRKTFVIAGTKYEKLVHCLSTGRTTHQRRGRQQKSNEIFQCPQRLQSQSAERLWMWPLVKALEVFSCYVHCFVVKLGASGS